MTLGTPSSLEADSPLLPMSSLTFGCASLGKDPDLFHDYVAVARGAMEGCNWFHASQEYAGGGAFMILRRAFSENPARMPRLILKIRCDNADILRFDVEDALRRLNVERVDLAQLCRAKHDRRPIVDDFLRQGEMWQACQKLRAEGKVGGFILEIFASFFPDAIRAVAAAFFPAYIFYFNPGERQASNELFDLLEKKSVPILSLRTLCGGNLDPVRIAALQAREPGHAAVARFGSLHPIFERSGCGSWPEFSLSFLKSVPRLLTTIAGTSSRAHLQELLEAARTARPMESPLAAEIKALLSQWSAA